MYERRRNEIDTMRQRFDREVEQRDTGARATGEAYLEMLNDFVDTAGSGPAADPAIANLDTTGTVTGVEDYEQWVESERHRVRRSLRELA